MTSHLTHPLTSTTGARGATAATVRVASPAGPSALSVRAASGMAAVLGGAALAAFALFAHAMPSGCVGDACQTVPHRETYVGLLFVGFLLAAVALVGLNFGVRHAVRGRSIGRVGRIFVGVGIATFLPVLLAGAWALWPCVLLGVLMAFTGIALIAIALTRAGVLPVPLGAFILIGVLLIPVFNDQDTRVLFLLPFAAALAIAGLWVLGTAAQIARHRR